MSRAPPGSLIWDGGSICSNARSAGERANQNSPWPSGGTPRATGNDGSDLSRPLRLGWIALKVQLWLEMIDSHFYLVKLEGSRDDRKAENTAVREPAFHTGREGTP